jgi:hypothetical protein
MEPKKPTEFYYKIILDDHFPNVISNMILSYVGEFNVRLVESFENRFTRLLICDNNIYTYNGFSKLHSPNKIYDLSNIKMYSVIAIINIDTILIKHCVFQDYHLYNMETQKITEDLGYINSTYRTSNSKYVVFIKYNCISIYNIIKNEFMRGICPKNSITDKIFIMDDIIYVISSVNPRIIKYTISGNCIGYIAIPKEFSNNIKHINITISNNEIVICDKSKILFYDLNGNEHDWLTLPYDDASEYYVTSNHIIISYKDNFYKYKRVL